MSWLDSVFLADIKNGYVLGVTLKVLKLSGVVKINYIKRIKYKFYETPHILFQGHEIAKLLFYMW